MTRTPASSRRGAALRKLLTVLCGLALFLVLTTVLGVWALGRFSPKILDATLSANTGAHVAVEENDTNLFTGRIAYAGLTITNPSRWQERDFLKVKRLVLDVDPLSFRSGGLPTVEEAKFDLERVTIVSKNDFFKDNNALDILNGLKAGSDQVEPAPAEPAVKQPFLIKRLRTRIGHVTIINHDGTPQRKVFLDRQVDFVLEATDVTELNFDEKVARPLTREAMRVALGLPSGSFFKLPFTAPK